MNYQQYYERGGFYKLPVDLFNKLLDQNCPEFKCELETTLEIKSKIIDKLLEENKELKDKLKKTTFPEKKYKAMLTIAKQEKNELKAELELYKGALHRENEAIHRVNELEEQLKNTKDNKWIELKKWVREEFKNNATNSQSRIYLYIYKKIKELEVNNE